MRKGNSADLRGYIRHWTSGNEDDGCSEEYLMETEHLTVGELKEEYVLTRMRMREGIPLRDFFDRFGEEACSTLIKNARSLAENGMVSLSDSNISLTENTILVSDAVILTLASDC